MSINWGPWQQTGAVNEVVLNQVQAKGIKAFTPQAGIACFADILSLDHINQVMAIMTDWSIFSKTRRYQSFYQNFWHEEENITFPALNKIHNLGNIKQQIKELFAFKLQLSIENFDDKTGFSAYGVDSLMAISLVSELSRLYDFKLESTLLFDYPTFDALATFIKGKIFPNSIRDALKNLVEVVQDDL